MLDTVPHFSTFGKNYTRRFKDNDLFEQLFSHILEECMKFHLVDTATIFVDATHVKACANSKKMRRRVAIQEALWYGESLKKEINEDRKVHNKKPLKDKDDNNKNSPTSGSDNSDSEEKIPEGVKIQKCSITDPESGWFRKGEQLKDGIKPLFPYKRPMIKDGFFKKYEYAYDELYDCYICPNNQVLRCTTTNRDGYREYKSCGYICSSCQYLNQCTASKDHVKLVTRHVWESDLEASEDIRYTRGNKEIYQHRKETIERIFGTAKEQHGFRYTQYIGKARMEMKVWLTFACMNLKKLAKMLALKDQKNHLFLLIKEISTIIPRNLNEKEKWCWN